ncbi:hypothetical protein JDV02_001502 [Purpureocillium takamizusanense]|uniref:Uncharacterized protein n=1 Tax=Purpureocillium takamizusanense TaxID=2060973 RepID=A0A9Q8Q9C0_9HYPO|nr:uncharacterized protein JDV02_001502 [Purpureocillium takamizusanense]UNI14924.1 hypothetical protein JDV02_001502 [Purpureocillium takamizusanense]
MQQNAQQVHEDLASLFSRNLTLNPELRAAAAKDSSRQEPEPALPVQSPPIVYSISQHYHHSAHVAKPVAAEQAAEHQSTSSVLAERPSSEPPQGRADSFEMILRRFGIDVASLTPAQVQLFRIADEPQKLRLIELWKICPPSRAEDIHSLAWNSTTLEQEEQFARLRLEQHQQDQAMSLDGTPVQTGDGRWTHEARDTEPYMVSGYQELMRRETERNIVDTMPRSVYSHFGTTVAGPSYTPATDPVYLGPDYVRQQQQMDMATQYGAFEQSRVAGDMDAMDVM